MIFLLAQIFLQWLSLVVSIKQAIFEVYLFVNHLNYMEPKMSLATIFLLQHLYGDKSKIGSPIYSNFPLKNTLRSQPSRSQSGSLCNFFVCVGYLSLSVSSLHANTIIV